MTRASDAARILAGKPRSNGGKAAQCVKCSQEIQPYAGRALSLYGSSFAHHAGQCPDAGERAASVRTMAQASLFAWSCGRAEPAEYDAGVKRCDVSGTDAGTLADHMRGHGMTPLPLPAMITLRRKPPAARLARAAIPSPFKTLRWDRVRDLAVCECSHGPGHHDGYLRACQHCPCTSYRHADPERIPMRGQYWSDGPVANSVIAITYTPYGSGITPELVTLYLQGDGSLTEDWSAAKWSRRRANDAARRAA